MTLQVFRDGRPDRRIENNALLAKLQKEDNHAQILGQFLRDQAKYSDGTYGHMGSVADASKGLTAPKAMLGGISQAERIARVRARMAANKPVMSLYFDEATGFELLSLEDQEAYEEGWICPECLQYQAVVANECNWRFSGERPSNPKYWGCGYRRDLY